MTRTFIIHRTEAIKFEIAVRELDIVLLSTTEKDFHVFFELDFQDESDILKLENYDL